ncbi:dipeptide ABC transporter ATP-binding protein [uncultured Amnibacterium sp.]|uniref:dipeptide ABC transporter ATP-binding protein n=1 Tax=uncultured Amnibacterium sp. TaxID=1631851 RepID=UPI0035CB56D8
MTAAAEDTTVLAVRDLVVGFGEEAGRVVDSVGFDLRAGRVLALVGESGSGKSLTAMSVLGLQPATATLSGSIRLQGEELLGAPPATLRSVRGARIGTVFQEPMSAFDPVYRIGDQIAEAIRAHARGRGPAVRQRVRSLLTSVGLPDPERIAGSFPHQLSGGQLQRAMIATALANDPVALIADEPTTALDVTVQAGILDLLRSLAADRGTAILLITHDMGVVADLADDVLVLRAGEAVEAGTARSVLRDPQHPYTRELLASVPSLGATGVVTTEPVATAEPVAVLDRAVVSYRRRGRALAALDGVDLRIGAGEVVGLVGESGSGKSTAGRALVGLVPLSAGSATVAGVDLRRAGRRARRAVRARIGSVFQDPASSLNPRATVGWSIAEPLQLHTDRSAQSRAERVAELLEAVRLPAGFADRYPHELSGGQRQRVAIARALALNPDLLIADEPTSALDVSVQAAVLDLLADLQSRLGFACLLISHDLAVVRRLAGTVVVLRDGRVVEQGPTDRVLTDPADPYTRRLLAAVPVPDPDAQAVRREQRLLLEARR